jgi:predicted MFS family arabinose efflux permease
MQREGLVGDAGGAVLAAVNYAGYLIGALTAARLAARPRALVLASLVATAMVTAGLGLSESFAAWVLLRGAAGVLSAWVMVGISAWAIGELAEQGRADLGAWVFSGVGLGIAAAGGLAWWRAADGAPALWVELGLLAAPAVAAIRWAWRRERGGHAPRTAMAPRRNGDARHAGLVLAYGIFGFGYILPATYLPAMARALVDDPALFGLAWPVFGAAAAVSTLAAGRALRRWHLQQLWALCHAMMAFGAALPLVSRSGAAIAAAALAVGGSFMVATMAGMQLARERAADHPAALLSRMVAAFAAGQISGPLVVLLVSRMTGTSGIEPTLALAALLLVASAVWLYRQPMEGADSHAIEPCASRG